LNLQGLIANLFALAAQALLKRRSYFFRNKHKNAVLHESKWVAQEGLIRVKSSFPVKTRLLFFKSARSTPLTSSKKNRQGACFFKVWFVSFDIVNSPPMNKLLFKTADVQGQSRQSNFQNLSIRILTDWRGFWQCA